MRFRVSKKAERELDQIFAYWATRAGLEAADKLVDSIAERFALLGEYPSAGRKCDEIAPGVFRFPAGDYLIYYRKKRGILHILHVIHGARERGKAYRREEEQ